MLDRKRGPWAFGTRIDTGSVIDWRGLKTVPWLPCALDLIIMMWPKRILAFLLWTMRKMRRMRENAIACTHTTHILVMRVCIQTLRCTVLGDFGGTAQLHTVTITVYSRVCCDIRTMHGLQLEIEHLRSRYSVNWDSCYTLVVCMLTLTIFVAIQWLSTIFCMLHFV